MASAMALAGFVLLTASSVISSGERPQRVAAAEILSRTVPGYAQYRSFSEDLSMNMEEIVALSVKHNVSDLHLCSAWPARWRIRGRMEAAPFEAPDVEELLREWWMTISGQYCWRMVSWILLCRWRKTSDCAAVRSHNGKVFLWRYGCYLRTARSSNSLAHHRYCRNYSRARMADSGGRGRRGVANLPRWRRWLAISINMPMRIF